MTDHPFASPGEKVFTYLEKLLHPMVAGFRVFRRKTLRGGFGRKGAVHLQKG